MKWLFAAAVALATLATAVAVVALVQVHSLRGDLRAVRVASHSTHTESQIAGLTARVNGIHRDLITCGDFQFLLNRMNTAGDSNGDTFYWGISGAVLPLPAHCINQ